MMWVLQSLVLVTSLVHVRATANPTGYCATNTFPNNSSKMHFTKEPVPYDYGFKDMFKSIHCCVKGYRSIEWFKDGVAYPWSAGVSNMILYPEAANQTLYTRRAARSDSGNYTCRLSNETHNVTHTVTLEILEKPTDAPKTMFISKDQWVEEGGRIRLYCEALVGRSYLADARRDLRWQKVWPNGTKGDLPPSHMQIKTTRDDVADIIGAYLIVDRVSAQDYGTYECVVHSNDVDSIHPVTVHYTHGGLQSDVIDGDVPWRGLVIGGAVGLIALVSIVVLHTKCTPRLLLLIRQARERTRSNAQHARVLEKEFDVLVCYTDVDGELVRGALVPTLSIKYKYRVLPLRLSTAPHTWYNEIIPALGRCRSVVSVVSPAGYSAPQLLTALRQLRALPLPPVIVLLQDLPKLKREAKESGESLVSLVRRSKLIAWRHVHERAFWCSLRLALPLPPRQYKMAKPETGETEDPKNSRSCSLTALV